MMQRRNDEKSNAGGSSNVRAENSEWDFKLATLMSIFESTQSDTIHSALAAANGDMDRAIQRLLQEKSDVDPVLSSPKAPGRNSEFENSGSGGPSLKKRKLRQVGLSRFIPSTTSLLTTKGEPSLSGTMKATSIQSNTDEHSEGMITSSLPLLSDRLKWSESKESTGPTRPKEKPLILYSPEDVEMHCPCTLIPNVLDKNVADDLLRSSLESAESWDRNRWFLFERMVTSPHQTAYFVAEENGMSEVSNWTYNGRRQDAPRRFLPAMTAIKPLIEEIVNKQRKSRAIHPYEHQGPWTCNVAAANKYSGPKESVGWHADKLTYLGPRPIIASLSLGATRFFRIRKVIPDADHPDTAGRLISIAVTHNSLLLMWPPMQEEWKHEVPTQLRVTPHPISGTIRINLTFRLMRPEFGPKETPVCKCGVAMVMRCVFKNVANYGRYFYMCYAGGSNMGKTCGAFLWVDIEEKIREFHERGKISSTAATQAETVKPGEQQSQPKSDLSSSPVAAVDLSRTKGFADVSIAGVGNYDNSDFAWTDEVLGSDDENLEIEAEQEQEGCRDEDGQEQAE